MRSNNQMELPYLNEISGIRTRSPDAGLVRGVLSVIAQRALSPDARDVSPPDQASASGRE